MIFVTIGTQAPFDRLIKIMDEISEEISEEVIAQTFNGDYIVKYMKTYNFLSPDEFNALFSQARLIVSHAGIGTIMSALVQAKPIIIIPRIARFGEHRNEHQLATAKKFCELGYVYVASNKQDLITLLNKKNIKPLHVAQEFASDMLIKDIQSFLSLNC